jgi:hypothetical protein
LGVSSVSGVQQHLKCPTCGSLYPTRASLSAHARVHNRPPKVEEEAATQVFGCPACGRTFNSKTSAFLHLRVHKSESKLLPIPMRGKANPPAPVKTTPQPTPASSSTSAAAASTSSAATAAKAPPSEDFVCPFCPRRFTSERALCGHQAAHISLRTSSAHRYTVSDLTAMAQRKHTAGQGVEQGSRGALHPRGEMEQNCEADQSLEVVRVPTTPGNQHQHMGKRKGGGGGGGAIVATSKGRLRAPGVYSASAPHESSESIVDDTTSREDYGPSLDIDFPFQCILCDRRFRVEEEKDIHEDAHTSATPFKM